MAPTIATTLVVLTAVWLVTEILHKKREHEDQNY